MPKITIDGHSIEVPDGTTIVQAARMIMEEKTYEGDNIAPPTMCYHSKLKTSGGYCRTCIVNVTKGSDRDPRPMPKPVPSCRTNVMDGMEVENITSPSLLKARAGVVEFLLLNHPLDCPVCDQAGECDLQDLGYGSGSAKTRYDFPRRTYKPIDIGPNIKLHMTRCIMCFRCLKVADQLTDGRSQGMVFRGEASEISTYIEKTIDNEFSGNIIDVCPVGALTDRTFRFKSRVWFTKPMDAQRNCKKCCGKVAVWYKGDEILRVTTRKDMWGESEDWICNECRFDKKETSDWTIEGPRKIKRQSVISQNHDEGFKKYKLGTKK
jgi:NADH-quinone oxidoreductase subunit G